MKNICKTKEQMRKYTYFEHLQPLCGMLQDQHRVSLFSCQYETAYLLNLNLICPKKNSHVVDILSYDLEIIKNNRKFR